MRINEAIRDVVVIYPGRFHPFHKGHASVYEHLRSKFPKVFVATSNKIAPPKSPFSFEEKRKMMLHAGIPASFIVQTKNPYQAQEILANFDPENTSVIFAVSQKDMAEDPRFSFGPRKDGSPSFFQPLPKNPTALKGFDEQGYIYTVPTLDFEVLGKPMRSATQLRAQFANADQDTRKEIVKDLYGSFDSDIYNIMQDKLTEWLNLDTRLTTLRETLDDLELLYNFKDYNTDKIVSMFDSKLEESMHSLITDSITRVDRQDIMNSIVAVPGIGAYSVGTLMAEIRSKMTALSDMSASKDPSVFRNMKFLFDKNIVGIMLDALVTAFDDLEYIRKKGGLSSRSIPKNVFDSVRNMNEGWSKKYKDSINCSNPKGFSQRAHCAGKKKTNEKITKRTAMGDVIDDFYKSDAPQFKGKSKAKRRQMAIAAKLAKMDEGKDGKKNLGTFDSKKAAEKHEHEVQYFKHMSESPELNSLKWFPVDEPELPSDYPVRYAIMKAIGATHYANWGKIGAPWSNEMIGGSGTYMIRGPFGHVLLDASADVRNKFILLSQVSVENRGSGIGNKIMDAIKSHADSRGFGVQVDKVTARDFFDKFTWLTPDKYKSTYTYTPDNESVKEELAKMDEGKDPNYHLRLERDNSNDMMILHIKELRSGKRTEVRGKSNYEGAGYDPKDPLHILLDKIGKAANISELMNGEVVSINPNHPSGAKAKKDTAKAFNEAPVTDVSIKEIQSLSHYPKGKITYWNHDDARLKKVGKLGDYNIHKSIESEADGGDHVFVIKKDEEPLGELILTQNDSPFAQATKQGFWTSSVRFTPELQGKGLAVPLYAYAVKKGYDIVSDDSQSKGSEILWQKLSKQAGINVYAWDRENNKFFAFDPENDPRAQVYSDEGQAQKIIDEYRKLMQQAGSQEEREELQKELTKELEDITPDSFDTRLVAVSKPKKTQNKGVAEAAVGRIVKGVNTTDDVGPNELVRQAAKFGNKVDRDGRPPELNKKARKNSTPNKLFNLGLAESTELDSDTVLEAILQSPREGIHMVIRKTSDGKKYIFRTMLQGKPQDPKIVSRKDAEQQIAALKRMGWTLSEEHLKERGISIPLASGNIASVFPHRPLRIKKSTPGRLRYDQKQNKRKYNY